MECLNKKISVYKKYKRVNLNTKLELLVIKISGYSSRLNGLNFKL